MGNRFHILSGVDPIQVGNPRGSGNRGGGPVHGRHPEGYYTAIGVKLNVGVSIGTSGWHSGSVDAWNRYTFPVGNVTVTIAGRSGLRQYDGKAIEPSVVSCQNFPNTARSESAPQVNAGYLPSELAANALVRSWA